MYNNQGFGRGNPGQGNAGNVGSNQQGGLQIGFGGLGFYTKGIAAVIGFASESIHAHKEKKKVKMMAAADETRQSQSQPPHSQHERSGATPTYIEHAEQHVGPEKKASHSSEKGCVTTGERELEEGDEEQWDLDDAQDELIEREPINPKNRPFTPNPKKIAQYFIDDYPVPQGIEPHGKLTLPVVLPQRRPKDRSRGFIRAYAPELMNAGIDQAMFLDFLETFNVASQASPWMNAINMAGLALLPLHLAPGIGQAATVALYLTVELMKNMQSRKRYHTVMDQMNEQFFQPRGLYAMVLTWNPETDATEVGINLNETIHKNLTPPEGIAKVTHHYKPSMGSTNGVAFTETAPLVFPALDKLEDDNSGAARTTREKIKSAKSFAGEYFDRRAQAKYAAENPDSRLNVGPKPTFTSRYSDPNNPTNSGDFLALLTAGKLTMPQRGALGGGFGGGMRGRGFGGMGNSMGGYGRDRMGMMGGGMNQQYPNQMGMSQMDYQRTMGGPQIGGVDVGIGGANLIVNGVKRILRHHVLYLLIVNMPSEVEMVEAAAFIEQARAAQ